MAVWHDGFAGEGDEGVIDCRGDDGVVVDGGDVPEENGLVGDMILQRFDPLIRPRRAASPAAAIAVALVGDGGAPYQCSAGVPHPGLVDRSSIPRELRVAKRFAAALHL
ncbi:hypothetical protein ACLOJK_039714 [Asimina triloba]